MASGLGTIQANVISQVRICEAVLASVRDLFVNRQYMNLYVRMCYKKEPAGLQ